MKFYLQWIKKYINKSNINIKYIKKILNNNGFETNIQYTPQNFIKTKIIKYKIFKKNIYLINIKLNTLKINLKIKYKKKINYKYIWINNNIFKNKIYKNNIFNIKIQNINNKYYYIVKKYINSIKKYEKFLEINIPYNRIDCNNIYNISKEICILNKKKIEKKKIKIKFKNKYIYNLKIKFLNKCFKYINNYKYLIINNTNIKKNNIPFYIRNKLENMGFTINNNILDIINYISVEFGHILIIFDFNKIKNYKIFLDIIKKKNNTNKDIIIKNNREIILKNFNNYNKKYLPNKNTKKILILSILFKKNFIYNNYNKNNYNSLLIYNNNCNKEIQFYCIKKISFLIKNIWNGNIILFKNIKNNKKNNKTIKIKYSEIKKKIGIYISKNIILNILKNINCKIKIKNNNIFIKSHKTRYDLNIKEDFIEEIIKFYGYNNIKYKNIKTIFKINKNNKYSYHINNIKQLLSNIGYTEIINFHFSNVIEEKNFFSNIKYIKIINPISTKMSILRSSLIPKLINNVIYNIKRKNNNIKLFEIGTCYKIKNNNFILNKKISLVLYGLKYKKNWKNKKDKIFNFYDIKGDIELLFKKQNKIKNFYLKKSKYKFLDKTQNANIYIKKKQIGFLGMINCKLQKKLSIKHPIFIAEINLKKILFPNKHKIKKLSKYPCNKRDITIIINKNIPINIIVDSCKNINNIKNIKIINFFLNKKLNKINKKNITLNLNIQSNKKTLKDIEINNIVTKCKKMLKKKFNALIDQDILNLQNKKTN